ncbi:serine hydrolase domain-containing protein [Agromyces mediolanus]|uniref:serine hydrolase domain-containing protein n=1 Tax=Agromyces mediolanus TaxID=41986 RepID=UPI0038358029
MTHAPAVPAASGPSELDRELTTLAERLARRPGLHHVSLAIADADGRSWSGAAGPGTPAGPGASADAPFFIASITKRFIVALVLQAHERGELDLDAAITAYLPAETTARLHVWKGRDRTPEITVRHLASHTSGLPDFYERRSGGPSLYRQLRAGHDLGWTFDDAIAIARDEQHPHFPPQDLAAPRQRASYSDTGFLLLIRILEVVTGRSFAELVAERIAAPLGLVRTWHPAGAPGDPAAPEPMPLHVKRREVRLDGVFASSHDLFSTTAELIAFERALVAGELFADPGTARLLTERRNRLRNAPSLRYGLGTMIFGVHRLNLPRIGPVTLVGHSGSTGTWLFSCPELGVTLAGTVDQTQAQVLPFRVMVGCLQRWTR